MAHRPSTEAQRLYIESLAYYTRTAPHEHGPIDTHEGASTAIAYLLNARRRVWGRERIGDVTRRRIFAALKSSGKSLSDMYAALGIESMSRASGATELTARNALLWIAGKPFEPAYAQPKFDFSDMKIPVPPFVRPARPVPVGIFDEAPEGVMDPVAKIAVDGEVSTPSPRRFGRPASRARDAAPINLPPAPQKTLDASGYEDEPQGVEDPEFRMEDFGLVVPFRTPVPEWDAVSDVLTNPALDRAVAARFRELSEMMRTHRGVSWLMNHAWENSALWAAIVAEWEATDPFET